MPFDLGDTVRLAADCKDPAGTLANATSVALTITLPDGTTTSPAVTNPPATTGKYTVDYLTVQAGLHRVRWVFTTPSNAYTDALDVREAVPPLMMSLADAKAHVNIPASDTSQDEELRGFVESTTKAVEYFVGPVVRRSFTEVRHGGRDTIALSNRPVISITSITAVESWQLAVDVTVLDADADTGIVRRTDGLWFPPGPYRMVYVGGRTLITANLTMAAKVILQHLWRTQYPSTRPNFGSTDYSVTEPIPGLGFAIPHRAMQMMLDDRDPGGMA